MADAWEILLDLLDRRALSAAEAVEALTRREVGPRAAKSAVAKAKRLGLLDDRRLAEDIADSAPGGAPQGSLRVQAALERRRVAPSAAAKAVRSVDDLARCREALALYLGRRPRPEDARGVARLAGHLARRGFTEESVRTALAEAGIEVPWGDA